MLQALRDDVIVRPVYEELSRGGIIIPQNSAKYKKYDGAVYGVVVSVGPEYKYDLRPGDKITWEHQEGVKILYQGVEYLKLKAKWVHGVVQSEN